MALFPFYTALLLVVAAGGLLVNYKTNFFGRWTAAVRDLGVWATAFVLDVFAAAFPPRDVPAGLASQAVDYDAVNRNRSFLARLLVREPSRQTVSAVRAFA